MKSATNNAVNEVTLESRTEQVKQFALGAGANVVGVADPRAWEEYAPEGHRPNDILSGARSVVVVGSRGPTAGAWRSPNHRLMEVNGYDFRNDAAIHRVADVIESEYGHQAIQAPGLPTGGHLPPMSMMLSAVLAGLGTRSLAANIILNPKYGLLYYSACPASRRWNLNLTTCWNRTYVPTRCACKPSAALAKHRAWRPALQRKGAAWTAPSMSRAVSNLPFTTVNAAFPGR